MESVEVARLCERIARMEDYIVAARERGDYASAERYIVRHTELCKLVPLRRAAE